MSKQSDFERILNIAGEVLHCGGHQFLKAELSKAYKIMLDEIIDQAKLLEELGANKVDNKT